MCSGLVPVKEKSGGMLSDSRTWRAVLAGMTRPVPVFPDQSWSVSFLNSASLSG